MEIAVEPLKILDPHLALSNAGPMVMDVTRRVPAVAFIYSLFPYSARKSAK